MRREFGASIRSRYFIGIIACPPDEFERELIRNEMKRDMAARRKVVDEIVLDSLVEESFRSMALNGNHGRVLCLGLIVERGGKVITRRIIGYNKRVKRLLQDEFAILSELWRLLAEFDPARDIIIGHDIFDFDLLFLYKRSIIKRVRPTLDLSFARYRSQPVYDTLREWEKRGKESIGLGRIAESLGLQNPKTGNLDDSKIYDYLCAGRHAEIAEYCFRGVVITRQIYYRMKMMKSEHGSS